MVFGFGRKTQSATKGIERAEFERESLKQARIIGTARAREQARRKLAQIKSQKSGREKVVGVLSAVGRAGSAIGKAVSQPSTSSGRVVSRRRRMVRTTTKPVKRGKRRVVRRRVTRRAPRKAPENPLFPSGPFRN